MFRRGGVGRDVPHVERETPFTKMMAARKASMPLTKVASVGLSPRPREAIRSSIVCDDDDDVELISPRKRSTASLPAITLNHRRDGASTPTPTTSAAITSQQRRTSISVLGLQDKVIRQTSMSDAGPQGTTYTTTPPTSRMVSEKTPQRELLVIVREMQAELDERTAGVNAIQRNFERLSAMYRKDQEELQQLRASVQKMEAVARTNVSEEKLMAVLQAELRQALTALRELETTSTAALAEKAAELATVESERDDLRERISHANEEAADAAAALEAMEARHAEMEARWEEVQTTAAHQRSLWCSSIQEDVDVLRRAHPHLGEESAKDASVKLSMDDHLNDLRRGIEAVVARTQAMEAHTSSALGDASRQFAAAHKHRVRELREVAEPQQREEMMAAERDQRAALAMWLASEAQLRRHHNAMACAAAASMEKDWQQRSALVESAMCERMDVAQAAMTAQFLSHKSATDQVLRQDALRLTQRITDLEEQLRLQSQRKEEVAAQHAKHVRELQDAHQAACHAAGEQAAALRLHHASDVARLEQELLVSRRVAREREEELLQQVRGREEELSEAVRHAEEEARVAQRVAERERQSLMHHQQVVELMHACAEAETAVVREEEVCRMRIDAERAAVREARQWQRILQHRTKELHDLRRVAEDGFAERLKLVQHHLCAMQGSINHRWMVTSRALGANIARTAAALETTKAEAAAERERFATVEADLHASLEATTEKLNSTSHRVVELRTSLDDARCALREVEREAAAEQNNSIAALQRLITAEEASESSFSCAKCLQLLKQPLTCVPCGHTVCETCFHDHPNNQRIVAAQKRREAEAAASAATPKPMHQMFFCPQCGVHSCREWMEVKSLVQLSSKFSYRTQVLKEIGQALAAMAKKKQQRQAALLAREEA